MMNLSQWSLLVSTVYPRPLIIFSLCCSIRSVVSQVAAACHGTPQGIVHVTAVLGALNKCTF